MISRKKGARGFGPRPTLLPSPGWSAARGRILDAVFEVDEGGEERLTLLDVALERAAAHGAAVGHLCRDCASRGRVRAVGPGFFVTGIRAVLVGGRVFFEDFAGWLCDECETNSHWHIDLIDEPSEDELEEVIR